MSSQVDSTPCAHINPNIFQLEKKPKHVLCHEIGAGSPCLKCDCTGLDLHFWRKICKVCSCRMDDHDIIAPEMDHGKIIIVVTEYAWIPTTDRILADKYFFALPENERPIVGTEGAVNRRQKLQYQLPHHDTDITAAKSIKSDEDRQQHAKYLNTLKEKVVGVGQLIEWSNDANSANSKSMSDKSNAKNNKEWAQSAQNQKENLNIMQDIRCQACSKKMNIGDVAIVTDHGKPNEVWHPNCFRCHTCNQRLVDMLYFYKDGIYYCGRHFGDSMYPRCSGCDELIFSKEYTYAEEKNWHFDHFCCFGCDKQLGGHRYMMRDEQPFCFGCYMKKFARTCHSCGNKIAPDQQRISFKDLHWHAMEACFQ
ncbi:unnamed protein product [Anisakis simplex]|uniref:LIM domain protein n=1 Tax=Anisakis simplex TaxID=6269 RepID=A0A0M3K895_ANISI|nr:unnamed protein product [Anisakis simplex]